MKTVISYVLVLVTAAILLTAAVAPAFASDAGAVDAATAAADASPSVGEVLGAVDVQQEMSALQAAYKAGGWLALLGALTALAVRIFRPLAGRWHWVGTSWGGYLVTTVAAFLATLGASLATGTDPTWGMAGAALVAALSSLALTPGLDAKTQARRKAGALR